MPRKIQLIIELPGDLIWLSLPRGVERRLHDLLDKQDSGRSLTKKERSEADGLTALNDFLSLLRLRSERLGKAT